MNEEAEGNGSTWLYVAPTLHDAGLVNYPGLASVTERDRVKIEKPPLEPTRLRRGLDDRRVEGVILEMGRGWPGRHQLVATLGLLGRYHVIYYWPEEAAVERVDSHRLAHYWALWARAKIYMRRHPMRDLLTGAEVNLVVATEENGGWMSRHEPRRSWPTPVPVGSRLTPTGMCRAGAFTCGRTTGRLSKRAVVTVTLVT